MNGWNEHNATNANRAARAPQDRVLWAASLALGACLLAAPACFAAEGAAPAMAGVKEFVLQYPHLGGSSQQAPPCGMTAGEANDALLRVLKAEGLPVVPIIDAKPSMIGVARVEILPEIISINNQDIDCTSWVSLAVQTQNAVRLLPVNTARNLTITYWRDGLLLNSTKAAHGRVLGDAWSKLAKKMAADYRLQQPPTLPDFDK